MPPTMRPRIGLITSFTRLFTTPVNAAPIMIPTARSTTLPRIMKARNSVSHEGVLSEARLADIGLFPAKRSRGAVIAEPASAREPGGAHADWSCLGQRERSWCKRNEGDQDAVLPDLDRLHRLLQFQ